MSDQKQKLKIDYSKAPKTPDTRQGCVATAADGRGRMLSKTTSESAEKAHFEHWCMAVGCHCWGDFGLAGPQGKGRIYLCAAHRAQWLTELEEKKQKEQAKRLLLPVKDEPDQGGLF